MDYMNQNIGETLGQASVEQVLAYAEQYCLYEKQRITLTNRAPLAACKAELALLVEQRRDLQERIRRAPGIADMRIRRRTALVYWALASVLTAAGLYFTKLSFDPFRSATNPYLYCLGIALTVTFLGELFLSVWSKDSLHKTVVTVAFMATLSALMLLAVIRGDLLVQKLKDESQSAVIIDDTNPPSSTQNDFYEKTLFLLKLTLPLIALGMDLAAGLAVREARRFNSQSGDDPERLSNERALVDRQMVVIFSRARALEDEAEIFEASFRRDFCRSMLTHTVKNAMTKLLLIAVGMLFFMSIRASAQESTNIVILVDLTQSVAVNDDVGNTPFQNNLRGVGNVLVKAPAGSRITILGITADSFSQPDILLSAKVGTDKGYFGEKLSKAHQALLETWCKRTVHLTANSPRTDILGALIIASQMFKENHDDRNELIIFSDMRQNTQELNVETQSEWSGNQELELLSRKGLIADLPSVDVYVLGVDNAGKDLEYWQKRHAFWLTYFKASNAQVRQYSTLSNIENR
jgi:hypothetical protein